MSRRFVLRSCAPERVRLCASVCLRVPVCWSVSHSRVVGSRQDPIDGARGLKEGVRGTHEWKLHSCGRLSSYTRRRRRLPPPSTFVSIKGPAASMLRARSSWKQCARFSRSLHQRRTVHSGFICAVVAATPRSWPSYHHPSFSTHFFSLSLLCAFQYKRTDLFFCLCVILCDVS